MDAYFDRRRGTNQYTFCHDIFIQNVCEYYEIIDILINRKWHLNVHQKDQYQPWYAELMFLALYQSYKIIVFNN